MGVTSRMDFTFRPKTPKDRMADSLPTPGPFTNTFTSRRPFSIAFWAAASAVVCAAKGVDFFAPRNPNPPALAHATVFPFRSVIVTMVLLNVAWMYTFPSCTVFFSFLFFTLAKDPALRTYVAFFLPATVFFLPLRVRALVRVLWPLTGSPFLCLRPR